MYAAKRTGTGCAFYQAGEDQPQNDAATLRR
jgi:hypothetical protein